MLSKSEILSLNSEQLKATFPTGNRRSLPQRGRETAKKWKKRVYVWCLRL